MNGAVYAHGQVFSPKYADIPWVSMRGGGWEVCNLLQDTYFFVETGNDIMDGSIGDDKYHRLFF